MSEGQDDYNFDDEVSLDSDEKNVGGKKQDWLKMTQKGQLIRGAFVYFHTVDTNAVRTATKEAKANGAPLTREQIIEVAKSALAKRAGALGKKVEDLTDTDRIDTSMAHFKVLKAHYQDGLGFALSRLGKDGPEGDAVWKRLPEVKTYITTLLLVYPTDSEGAIVKETLAKQIKENKLKLVPWRFSSRVYDGIWKTNDGLRQNNLSLASQDVQLECKEPQYQNIEVSAAGPALWLKNETLKNAVIASAVNMYDKLVPFREMTTDQLRAKLGIGGSVTDDVSADNFQDMLDQV